MKTITEKHAEFLNRIEASLDLSARLEFDYSARVNLAMSMEICGLETYPEVVGTPQGDRCSGDMICEQCLQTYYCHPADWRFIGYGNVPFLNILCDGRRVKL